MSNLPTIKVLHFVTYANLHSQPRKTSLLAGFTGPIDVALLADKEFPAGDVPTTQVKAFDMCIANHLALYGTGGAAKDTAAK
ncbi:hypothetical protein [Pseudomonas gingeri]|uniref:hypothetical protein n=1 Tax=Pseudomonas gingeri TaxID=117681 RepID=UPI00210C0AA9|nr:hypothetical protein [Pseudomonas gingeri]